MYMKKSELKQIIKESIRQILKEEIKEFGGKRYKKQYNGKWVEVSEHGMTKKEHKNLLISLNKDKQEYRKKQLNSISASRSLDSTIGKINDHKNAASKLSDKEYDEEELGGQEESKINWSKNADGDYESTVNGKKFLIYKGTSGFILNVDGKNKIKGSLAVCKAGASDIVKQNK